MWRVRAGWCALVPRERGGVPSLGLSPPSGRYLSFAEREDIALLRGQGLGVRAIARHLGRPPLTISRELHHPLTPSHARAHLDGGALVSGRSRIIDQGSSHVDERCLRCLDPALIRKYESAVFG